MAAHFDYTIAYNAVFIGYGIVALVGLAIVLFLTGPLVRNEELQAYADNETDQKWFEINYKSFHKYRSS